MALTKAAATIVASQSVPAATVVTGSAVNLSSVYGGELELKITNGGSAPTSAPTIEIQASHDGTNWYSAFKVSGDTTASSINSWAIPCPVGRIYIRGILTAGATNASTMEVMMEQVTGY